MPEGPKKILSFDALLEILAIHRQKHHKIIFAHGVFDFLHRGHITLLAEAKNLKGILVVGVESDQNVKKLKGPQRPIHSEEARLFVLSHIEPVDYIFLIPEYKNPREINKFYTDIYKKLKADVLVTCVEAGKYGLLKKQHAREAGMQFVNIHTRYDQTTSKVIEILKKQIKRELDDKA